MKQIKLLRTRLLLACAACVFAASVCGAQTPSAAAGKTAAPEQEKPAGKSSPLEEELAKTPGGKTVARFLTAFNSGDLKTMRAFHESIGGDLDNADKDFEFYEKTGGLKPHSLTSSAKDKFAVLVQTKKDARWIIFEFTLDAQEPYGIATINVRPAAAPTGN